MRRSTRRAGVAVLTLAVTAGLAACGSSSSGAKSTTSASSSASSSAAGGSGAGGGSASADAALVAMLPSTLKSAGKITIGTDSTYAPSEFLAADGKTVEGFDVDLFNAVAAKLGLKTTWVSAPFDSIIAGVKSAKYDIGVSSFTINSDREKQADMIQYFSAGTQWATATGNPEKVDPANACGKKVAVQTATVEVTDIQARSKACTTAGKAAITIDQYQGQDTATASVVSGKDDAMLADSPVIAYAVKQTAGKLALLGSIYAAAPYGYVIAKNQGQFSAALAGALKDVETDGTYAKVLATWGVSQGAVSSFPVNPTVAD